MGGVSCHKNSSFRVSLIAPQDQQAGENSQSTEHTVVSNILTDPGLDNSWYSEEITEKQCNLIQHCRDPPLNLQTCAKQSSSGKLSNVFQNPNQHNTIINYHKKFLFLILRIQDKITVPIRKVHQSKITVEGQGSWVNLHWIWMFEHYH